MRGEWGQVTFASGVTDRIRAFRTDRTARIIANETPLPFSEGSKSKTVLHCIPVESFAGSVRYDIFKFKDQAHRIPPIVVGGGWSPHINLDGVVTHSSTADGCFSYTQLFRNGVVEAVEGHWLSTELQGKRYIPYGALERDVLAYTKKILEIQKELGVNTPIMVALTLTATKGLEMAQDIYSVGDGHPIKEQNLILPESVVEDFNAPLDKFFKPIFDLIWNACGFMKSRNFDEEGNWNPQR